MTSPNEVTKFCTKSSERGENAWVLGRAGDKQIRGLVSKETVVLRQWGRETQNFVFKVD